MDDYHSEKSNERQKSSLQEANFRPHKPWRLTKMGIYWNINEILKSTEEWQPSCWIQVTCPTGEDQQKLEGRFQIPDYFSQDASDTGERARYEYDDGWMLITLRIPYVKEICSRTPYTTVPLGIIHKYDVTIMVYYYETNMMIDFVSCQQRQGSGFIDYVDLTFRLFLSSAVWYLKRSGQINTLIEKAKYNLDHEVNNESLIRLSRLQDPLACFITSICGNRNLLARLKSRLQIDELDVDPVEDVNIEMTRARETTSTYASVLESIMDTCSSIINNNVNMVMKTLASVFILIMSATLMASLHGMNVINGMETYKYGFIAASGTFILAAVVSWAIMRHEHMLQTEYGRVIRRTKQQKDHCYLGGQHVLM